MGIKTWMAGVLMAAQLGQSNLAQAMVGDGNQDPEDSKHKSGIVDPKLAIKAEVESLGIENSRDAKQVGKILAYCDEHGLKPEEIKNAIGDVFAKMANGAVFARAEANDGKQTLGGGFTSVNTGRKSMDANGNKHQVIENIDNIPNQRNAEIEAITSDFNGLNHALEMVTGKKFNGRIESYKTDNNEKVNALIGELDGKPVAVLLYVNTAVEARGNPNLLADKGITAGTAQGKSMGQSVGVNK